ncbi:MAG: hypothetical protein QS748_09485 [Candidatus Endonucleobacter bathymodioli]|uniref:Uncharacterized protein n=1 Tax=Candidatus Endonucleibacter bathymodioli TaxID=539814 RepID=A0AA90ST94_9GAMM|nr:hypothetical protein [Candidatus Endonucleobacter bathymodioli]
MKKKKDALYDLRIRGMGFDKGISKTKMSEHKGELDYYTSHFDEIQRMDIQFKKPV